MEARTIFLSRLIGLYSILISLALMAQKEATIVAVTAMVHDRALMLFIGIVIVIAGLAVVLGHNVWSGGAAAVIVTLLGWAATIKGVLFLFLPGERAADFYLGTLHYEQYFYFYAGFTLLLGCYLTYAGFKAAAR